MEVAASTAAAPGAIGWEVTKEWGARWVNPRRHHKVESAWGGLSLIG